MEIRWLGRIPFKEALQLQNQLSEKRRLGAIPNTVLFLEHEPVYTIGRTRDRSSLRPKTRLPHPVIEINRGGQATYHGPGQLVGYPILDLTDLGRDLHRYLHSLETALVNTCKKLNVQASVRKGLTGVWVQNRKIASIGVGVRKWITMHGFALNVASDLSGFQPIVPCGIQDVSMTSIEHESGQSISTQEISHIVTPFLEEEFNSLRTGAPVN